MTSAVTNHLASGSAARMRPHARNPTALKAGPDFSFSAGNPTPSSNEREETRGNYLPLRSQTPHSHHQEPMTARNHGTPGGGSNPGMGRSRFRHEPNHQSRAVDSTIGRADVGAIVPNQSEPILFSLKTRAERIAFEKARDQEKFEKIRARRQRDSEERKKKRQLEFLNHNTTNSTSRDNTPTPPTGPTTNSPSSPGGSSSSSSSTSNYQGNRRSPSPPSPLPQPSLPLRQVQAPIYWDEWRTRPEIHIRLSGLPMQYKTIDVYETFQQFGVIEAIKLFENTLGTRDGGGEVKFRYNTISKLYDCIL